MSEDIRFKISADESGAVNSFKRLRNEVLNNEHGIKRIGSQGKEMSRALKDMSSVLGPEFGILGDRIDHITGALADVRGASLAVKASLVGLVAVGAFEVGQMISNWILQTEAWQKANEEAIKSIAADQAFLRNQNQDHFDLEMKIIQAAATEEQKLAEFRQLESQKQAERLLAEEQLTKDRRKLEAAIANDLIGYGKEDNAINEAAVLLQEEKVKLLNEQLQIIDLARAGPSDRELELARRQQAQQPDREFSKVATEGRIPELKAEQQRMITRGNGGRDIDRLIEIAKQQQALAQKDAMETREIRKVLFQIRDKFPDEVFE